jgi:capsid protein
MNNIRRWDAASPDVVQNWVSEVKSINEDLRTQGEALRARARDLEQNNDYASRYLNLVETNIVGEGIKLQSKARTNKASSTTASTESSSGNLPIGQAPRIARVTVGSTGLTFSAWLCDQFAVMARCWCGWFADLNLKLRFTTPIFLTTH